MRAVDLIAKKRAGEALTDEEINSLIQGYVANDVPDYQMAAFLMAVCFSGMNAQETAGLTIAMLQSGDVVDLSDIPGVKVDKHSTGGVGDTTTLAVGPMVAACGAKVAKMSGRGLGHTGGTLDKLESIPGLKIELPLEQFKQQVREISLAIVGQTGNLVPADKKLYALRDVTSTVNSLPLIASSIMSKKLASGADAIVLDVKTGSGAFAETVEQAKALASTMVDIGRRLGKKVVAIITDMNQPLGLAVGNALEVREAIELLSGKLSSGDPLYEVCMLLAGKMLLLSGQAGSETEARAKLVKSIESGAALAKFREMVAAQGGDSTYIDSVKINELCAVKRHIPVFLPYSGHVQRIDAQKIGLAAQLIGAGRSKKDDAIDPAVGLVMHKRLGEPVSPQEPVCTLYVNDDANADAAIALLTQGIEIEHRAQRMVYAVLD